MKSHSIVLLSLALALAAPLPALAQQSLQQQVDARLAEAGPGIRFGLLVTDEAGTPIVAVNPDQRFLPASNTKVFTTAAAFATLPVDQPDTSGGAAVRLEGGDVVLEGHGDARLSSADDCTVDCLATLADAVAAKTRSVHDVIGDDTLYPDQRWSPGMAWNNIPTRSGTGISALTLDDNELALRIVPGKAGAAPSVEGPAFYAIDNQAVTLPAGAAGATGIGYDRTPLSHQLRLTGSIAADAKPETLRMGIDDPADYAAARFKALLEARGVKVTGTVRVRHRTLMPSDDPEIRKGAPAAHPPMPAPLAQLTPPPLVDDLSRTNKMSQNLHAELMLRRLGIQQGSGSIADGLAVVSTMLDKAQVPRWTWDFSDGSGMSTYNRVAPRGMVTLLRWIAAQPWGAAWRATLPEAGVDGTLIRRFKGTPLQGRLWAKTGTLNGTNTLSGYLTGASGKTYSFAFFANDVPQDASATKAMDATLELIAAGS